jgi:UDP-GlcNAc:undecaprenyl-phosphate GlcNAc-1-phosphate transferase
MSGLVFFSSLIISWGVSGLISRFGEKLGIIDDPKTHNLPKVTHKYPVPRGGGLPIFLATSLTLLFTQPVSTVLVGIVGSLTLLAGVGFLDDRFEEKVSPLFRLGINILAAAIVIACGIGIAFISNPLGGIINLNWMVADTLALVWLVSMQNIVGWSSGVDGQLPGFVIIAAVTMGVIGYRLGVDPKTDFGFLLAMTTAGAYLGFLPWNWYPQKIMPGYGGKSMAGFLLGIIAILSTAKVGALVMVLGIPLLDAARVIFKRIFEKRSPFLGGREHLHHYLLDMGWSPRSISILYLLTSLAFAILAINLNTQLKYFTMAIITLGVGGLLLWLQKSSISSKRHGQDSG